MTFQAAKDVVLAEKPVISDDSNQLDPSLLDELLANIATLSSVYHKPPDAFVTRVKTVQKTEEEEYPDGEGGYSETSSHAPALGTSSPATTSNVQSSAARSQVAAPAPVPDLLDLMGMDNSSAIVAADPITPSEYVYYYVSVILFLLEFLFHGIIPFLVDPPCQLFYQQLPVKAYK